VQTTDKETLELSPLSFSEEAAWHEFRTSPASFFLRGLTLSVPLPPGTGRQHAEKAVAEKAVAELVVAELVARHEIFRTEYQSRAGQGYRRVLPTYHHDVVEADAPVYGILGQDPANLLPSDLVRVWLTPADDGRRKLSVDINEMITDSWSCARMQSELTELVERFASGREPAPRPPAVGYSDFAREQRERELPAKLTAYWREKLAGLKPPAYVTEDGPDPSGEPAGERVAIFADDMNDALRRVCTQHRLSRFMAVVALTTMVLATRSGERDITLCTSVGTRTARYTKVHGNFSNLVLLRTVLPTEPTFAELAVLTRSTVLGGLAHQEIPFRQLQAFLPEEVATPPVRVHYLPHRVHHYTSLDDHVSGDSWAEEAMFATWPIEIGFAEDSHGRVAIWLNYDASRYTHASMERLIRDCGRAILAIGSDQQLTCARLLPRLEAAG
jgi:hypothetical protein